MKRLLVVTTLAIVIALTAPAVFADSFTYTFSGADGAFATGTLVGNPIGGGAFDITSGSIDVAVAGTYTLVTGIGELTATGFDGSDNILNLTTPYTSFAGISFAVGGDFVNLYTGDAGFVNGLQEGPLGGPYIGLAEGSNSGGYSDTGGTLEVTTTPEPSGLLLFGTGLLGLAAICFRRGRLLQQFLSGT